MNKEDKVLTEVMKRLSLNDNDIDSMIDKLEDMKIDARIDGLIYGLGKMNVKISKTDAGRRKLLTGLKRQKRFKVRRVKSIIGKKTTMHSQKEKNEMFNLMEKLKQDGGGIFGKKRGKRVGPLQLTEFQKRKRKLQAQGKAKTITFRDMQRIKRELKLRLH